MGVDEATKETISNTLEASRVDVSDATDALKQSKIYKAMREDWLAQHRQHVQGAIEHALKYFRKDSCFSADEMIDFSRMVHLELVARRAA